MSWQKVKLGDILTRKRNLIPIEADKEYKLVTIRLYHNGVVLREKKKGADISSDKMAEIKTGDFVLSGIDARNGAFGIVSSEMDGAVITNDFWCLDVDEDRVDKHFFYFLTTTPFFDHICKQASDGTTQRIRLQAHKFFNYTIELPSKEEQTKIYQKLQKLKSKNEQLLSELTHQQTLLTRLRQSILQEAVQGKLTAQWRQENPNMEPASELLRRIREEKAASGKKEKSRELGMKAEEMPFELPEGWVWCRLGELADNITKGSSPKWQGVRYVEDPSKGILFITSKNVGSYNLLLEDMSYVEKKFNDIEPRSILKNGDLLTNIVGASIGRTAIYDLDEIANINQAVCLIRIETDKINKAFLLHLMNSDYTINLMFENQFAPGRANLSMSNIANFPVPLPPLPEQQAIVATVERLLGVVGQLETESSAQRALAEGLLQAALREAMSGMVNDIS